MRLVTLLSSSAGAILCVATAATGIYFGMINHPEMRETHLHLAIACVFVSLVAHVLAFIAVRKHKA